MKKLEVLFWVFLLIVSGTEAVCPYNEQGLVDWDNAAVLWGGALPVEGESVTIKTGLKVRLNVSPPPLGSITIEKGAALIWGDVADLTLKVSYLLIRGRFEIGSETCRFTKKARITLTGLSNSTLEVPGFGRKFIGVTENGTVELHGGNKLSWTKLIQTVPAARETCGILYNHQESAFSAESVHGIHAIVFNPEGDVYDFQTFLTGHKNSIDAINKFDKFIKGVPGNKVLSVFVNGRLGNNVFPKRDWEKVYTSIETVGGMTTGTSVLRDVNGMDAYAFIMLTGDPSSATEAHDKDETKPISVTIAKTGLNFLVRDGRRTELLVMTRQVANPKIVLRDDVSSWKVGDSVVITSTDYEWRQAEVAQIVSCSKPECQANEIRLNKPFQFLHFGEITQGVDERAEVALLTRDIVIEGELEKECYSNYDDEVQLCKFFHADTFGGHFKMIRGFKSAHIEQVEFFQMGQQSKVGSYPIHFHMCDDVDGAWVRSNSIHNSQARCVTIHGTDGLEVKDNVCYKHKGHGFFLEDSVEQRNILDGNLGIGTEPGTHILSDRSRNMCTKELSRFCNALSTFWITHPNNYIRNNVAAGSDKNGFQLIVAKEPLGPSKARQLVRGLVTRLSAKFTKVTEFNNNVAHSNVNRGLFFDDFISNGEMSDGVMVPENGVLGGSSHTPRDPPTRKGKLVVSYIRNFLAYKNKIQNIWSKAGKLVFDHVTLADSPSGIEMATAGGSTYTMVNNSKIIGETDNVGTPTDGLSRSYASRDLRTPLQGVGYFQGPVFVRNTFFDKYKHETINGVFRPAGALSFKKNNPYPSTAHSDVKGITFGFCDKTQGNWVFDSFNGTLPKFGNRDGSRQITFHDHDGSVTGTPNTQVVRPNRFFTTPCCVFRETWNDYVCPHQYAKAVFSGSGGVLKDDKIKDYPVYMRRDDRPDDAHAIKGERGLPYLLMKGKSYTVYFNGTAPDKLRISGRNLETGDSVRLGICYPKDVQSIEISTNLLSRRTPMRAVSTIGDLDNDGTFQAYFWDKASGLLFIKMAGDATRVDGERCPGGMCPMWTITRTGGSAATADCYADAYSGAYNKPEDVETESCKPAEKPCQTYTSEEYGVPIEVGSDVPQFTVPCPPDSEPINAAYKGCFKDNWRYKDLAEKEQLLFRSMTRDGCIKRCHSQGYAYAAVQNGYRCVCGTAYGAYGRATGGCTKRCSGNSTQMCGGKMKNDVFATGIAPPEALPQCGPGKNGAEIDGKCYFLSTDYRSYMDAQRACVHLGGELASINTADVQEKVIRYIRNAGSRVWFGLNKVLDGNNLVNVDGSHLGGFSYFQPEFVSKERDIYGYMNINSLFHWWMTGGNSRRKYLCQLPKDGATRTVESCGTNSSGKRLGSAGTCYAVINDKLNYHDAVMACLTRHGVAAPMDTEGQWKDIVEHIQLFGASNTDYYVGKKEPFEGVYTELIYSKLYISGQSQYNRRNGIVCQLETVSASKPCSTEWTKFGDSCYLYLGRFGNYNKADKLCNQGVSSIVTIKNKEENQFVGDLVKNFNVEWQPSVLLGYMYNKQIANFQTSSGTSMTYANWKTGDGVANVASGNCVALMTSSSSYTWKNQNCKKGITAIVCQSPAA
ncbi:cell surface hyaluronidase-like [Gigantopelta aegis]|uniref:cell surface hyaluronidase-like n=1 Tax=Gigantopelta aegis TaxID=1735272 RepID=UPI001B88C073|nr:cell surface hyaluronidase-like [Gigantopelta aegis]